MKANSNLIKELTRRSEFDFESRDFILSRKQIFDEAKEDEDKSECLTGAIKDLVNFGKIQLNVSQ